MHQTVALIDSKTFASKLKSNCQLQLDEGNNENSFTESDLLIRQIIYADKILMNKVDLLDDDIVSGGIAEIREIVQKVNPEA